MMPAMERPHSDHFFFLSFLGRERGRGSECLRGFVYLCMNMNVKPCCAGIISLCTGRYAPGEDEQQEREKTITPLV